MITLHKAVYNKTGALVKGPAILIDPKHIILLDPTVEKTTFVTLSNPNARSVGVFERLDEIKKLLPNK